MCSKNYLIDNEKNKSIVEKNIEILNDKNDSRYHAIKHEFEEDFLKAKGSEENDFAKKFLDAKLFSNDIIKESPFTLK